MKRFIRGFNEVIQEAAVCVAVILMCFVLGNVVGCNNIQKMEQDRQVILKARAATTQAIANTQVKAAALPADDPVRKVLVNDLGKQQAKLLRYNTYLDIFDAILDGASEVQKAASTTQPTGAGSP